MLSASEYDEMMARGHLGFLPELSEVLWRINHPGQLLSENVPSEPSPTKISASEKVESAPSSTVDVEGLLAEVVKILEPQYLNAEKYPKIAAYLRSRWDGNV